MTVARSRTSECSALEAEYPADRASAAGVQPVPGARKRLDADEHAARFGHALIFGEPERPLYGRLHPPLGSRMGAVLLCNPWGYEENCAFLAFQELAWRLAELGFEVLRFDYSGLGNSWGSSIDPRSFDAWIADCACAIRFLERRNHCRVHAVGLRLGAALVLLASRTTAVATAVLWDPVVSGRRYLRALKAMSMMGVSAAANPEDPRGLLTIGHALSSSAVDALSELDMNALSGFGVNRAVLLLRPGNADGKRLFSTLQRLGIQSSVDELEGTDLLLDCAAEQSIIPTHIVEHVLRSLREAAAGVRHDVTTTSALSRSAGANAVLIPPPNGGDWTEEHLQIGPSRLAATLTMPRQPRYRGVVVMGNNGIARSIGPARAWVEWARAWADAGITTCRFDFAGLGYSELRAGQSPGNQYPADAVQDFRDVIGYLRTRGMSPAVAVGLCSGAFLAIDAAAAGVGLSAAVAINSQLFHLPDPPGSPQRAVRAAPPTAACVQRFFEETRVGRRLARELPFPFWWLLDLLRLQPSPLRGATVARSRTELLLIYGEDNLGLSRLKQRAPAELRRWQSAGRLLVMAGLDHSMFAPGIRPQVEAKVREFLCRKLDSEQCGPSITPPA